MNTNLGNLRKRVEQLKGEKNQLRTDIRTLRAGIKDSNTSLVYMEQAREIIRAVGLKTQETLQFHIADITTLALQAIFPDPYELKVEFVQRRNKMECDLMFVRNGQEVDPIESSGYGAVDVASFALRVASWSMQNPRSLNTIILDEPFKFLSENYQPQASILLKELSTRLGLQFIIVTHEEVLTDSADKIFHIAQRKDKDDWKISELK